MDSVSLGPSLSSGHQTELQDRLGSVQCLGKTSYFSFSVSHATGLLAGQLERGQALQRGTLAPAEEGPGEDGVS